MKMNLKKGFTLIELLVVVAIIGVLASVVLASLNSARTKGTDAAIKANLANLRAQAEIYYDGTGVSTYKGTATAFAAATTSAACITANSVFASLAAGVTAASNASSSTWAATCALGDATHDSWAVSVPLKATSGSWCVDSTGAARAGVAAGGNTALAACP